PWKKFDLLTLLCARRGPKAATYAFTSQATIRSEVYSNAWECTLAWSPPGRRRSPHLGRWSGPDPPPSTWMNSLTAIMCCSLPSQTSNRQAEFSRNQQWPILLRKFSLCGIGLQRLKDRPDWSLKARCHACAFIV